MKYEFGGSRAFSTRQYKSFLISLEWDEVEDGEPILILFKNNSILQVGLSSAVMWADPSGSPTDQAFIRAANCCEDFGFSVDNLSMHDVKRIGALSASRLYIGQDAERDRQISKILQKSSAIREVVDVVMHGIPDLLRMPKVRPVADDNVAGVEMTLKLNDKVLREVLV
jgi:hypothetical protein